jgi:hypothetical protein
LPPRYARVLSHTLLFTLLIPCMACEEGWCVYAPFRWSSQLDMSTGTGGLISPGSNGAGLPPGCSLMIVITCATGIRRDWDLWRCALWRQDGGEHPGQPLAWRSGRGCLGPNHSSLPLHQRATYAGGALPYV